MENAVVNFDQKIKLFWLNVVKEAIGLRGIIIAVFFDDQLEKRIVSKNFIANFTQDMFLDPPKSQFHQHFKNRFCSKFLASKNNERKL